MYQNQSHLSGSQNVGVEKLELPHRDDSLSVPVYEKDGTLSVAVVPSNAKSSDALELSSGQLILCLVAFALLIGVAVWYLENVGERFERLQRRIRHWRTGSEWGYPQSGQGQLPKNTVELALPDTESNVDDLADYGESKKSLERAAFQTPELGETYEPNQDNRQEEVHVLPEDSRSIKELPEHDSLEHNLQSSETAALKHELAEQANEFTTLKEAWHEENRVSLEDAEVRYQILADELAATQLAQSEMQTDLINADLSLKSLTAKNDQTEQEMETTYEDLRDKGILVGQLESKLVASQSRAESLEEKLKLAHSDLETQAQQTLSAESRIEEMRTTPFKFNGSSKICVKNKASVRRRRVARLNR